MQMLSDSKTEIVATIIKERFGEEITRLLVVGCGSGIEAAILAQQLNAEVLGIDLESNFDKEAQKIAELKIGDATALEFADETFDFVFSYHALEHINDPAKALSEMNRVIKNGCGFWIGTPNRARIIGYIGGKNTTLAQKIKWNYSDWTMRFAGKFRNEFGAHAGFTSPELKGLISDAFSNVEDMTKMYFSRVYAKQELLINMIAGSGLSGFIFPSVYFTGSK